MKNILCISAAWYYHHLISTSLVLWKLITFIWHMSVRWNIHIQDDSVLLSTVESWDILEQKNVSKQTVVHFVTVSGLWHFKFLIFIIFVCFCCGIFITSRDSACTMLIYGSHYFWWQSSVKSKMRFRDLLKGEYSNTRVYGFCVGNAIVTLCFSGTA